MARNHHNLLELDVEKLFEEQKIDEISEIEKLIDAEIEKKRVELRSMVGDRYKDILAASDAIKNMKEISENIVQHIETITTTCDTLVNKTDKKPEKSVDREKIEERKLVIEIWLGILLSEQIWIALDQSDNLKGAELYLLAQHVYTGLSLANKKYLNSLPILQQIKANLHTIRKQIFKTINSKLESVEITAEETSRNLNALILLQNQTSDDLLSIFIEHRKSALNTVINSEYSSVRLQISAMVQCLITTVHLLHDCFICGDDANKGLIWGQLDILLDKNCTPTLSKVNLPPTPLISYIPDIIREFRPKYKKISSQNLDTAVLHNWLKTTKITIENGLENSLKLVTNIRGLHIIREEGLKIELPTQWEKICAESNLPSNFNVWYNFFQNLLTNRAKELIKKKVVSIGQDLENDVKTVLNSVTNLSEMDLRWYAWQEEVDDVSRSENKHAGLSMKTMGYSPNIVNLCEKLDSKYRELLVDISPYLYGKEYEKNEVIAINDSGNRRKFVDREELENYLSIECSSNSRLIIKFLDEVLDRKSQTFVLKSIICARFLEGITNLCPHFNKCCSFNSADEWHKICQSFSESSLRFWENWVEKCVDDTDKEITRQLENVSISDMITLFAKWDTIEIQEQTEEKIFKSYIKVPLKSSIGLQNVLKKLNEDLSYVLPHTLPKQIHQQFIERNSDKILLQYRKVLENNLNQNQALQFLFDVKFLTSLCIPRENLHLVGTSQDICDKLRCRIDPFDLDVFYSYLQLNVKKALLQSQVILGCLLPSPNQLANLVLEKAKEQDKDPSILTLSVPSSNSWFPLLPITVPSNKAATITSTNSESQNPSTKPAKSVTPKKSQDPSATVRSAAALFGGIATDWFS